MVALSKAFVARIETRLGGHRAFGLNIPHNLLALADEVIE
jgi:hypothetical protein